MSVMPMNILFINGCTTLCIVISIGGLGLIVLKILVSMYICVCLKCLFRILKCIWGAVPLLLGLKLCGNIDH